MGRQRLAVTGWQDEFYYISDWKSFPYRSDSLDTWLENEKGIYYPASDFAPMLMQYSTGMNLESFHMAFSIIDADSKVVHDDVIKWKHFPRNWPFVQGIHRSQIPVTRSFDAFFDLCLNIRLSKQSWGWRFETLSRSLWRHCNYT